MKNCGKTQPRIVSIRNNISRRHETYDIVFDLFPTRGLECYTRRPGASPRHTQCRVWLVGHEQAETISDRPQGSGTSVYRRLFLHLRRMFCIGACHDTHLAVLKASTNHSIC